MEPPNVVGAGCRCLDSRRRGGTGGGGTLCPPPPLRAVEGWCGVNPGLGVQGVQGVQGMPRARVYGDGAVWYRASHRMSARCKGMGVLKLH